MDCTAMFPTLALIETRRFKEKQRFFQRLNTTEVRSDIYYKLLYQPMGNLHFQRTSVRSNKATLVRVCDL